MKKVVHVLAPYIANIVNLSLQSGVFPQNLKRAHVTPLLNKPSLCPQKLPNYRPITDTANLAKTVERFTNSQFTSHLSENHLYVPFQSAYRRFHSVETALTRVLNDLLVAVDRVDAAMLVLLDMSAAFDTTYHQILIERLQERAGVSGMAFAGLSLTFPTEFSKFMLMECPHLLFA